MRKNKLMQQLRNNVNETIWMYLNGQMDEGEEEYPNLIDQEWWDYCVPEIYNMQSDGGGFTRYADGICDNLKFLGNDVIHKVIVDTARDEGLLAE